MGTDAPKPSMKKPRDLPLPIGTSLKGYHLDEVIGRGGMGTVYLATHALLGRRAAVKVLASDLIEDQSFVSRFFHEAKVVNDIAHPNIVDIMDFVHESNPTRVAYVMEFVDGPSLKQVIKQQRFTVIQAVNIAYQLVDALHAVHAAGVIHRDLKPDNVLVVEPLDSDMALLPSAKLLDFGIAKSAGASVGHQTMQGEVLGTPKYMAPEQITADPVSPATDVYALGEIFYEMVAGRRVFNGPTNAVMTRKLSGQAPPLPLPDDVPCAEAIQALVQRAIVLLPSHRISLEQFGAGLLEIRQTVTGKAHDVPIARRRRSLSALDSWGDNNAPSVSDLTARPWATGATGVAATVPARRVPVTVLVVAASVLIACGVGVGAWWAARPRALEPLPVADEATPAVTTTARGTVRVESVPTGAAIVDVATRRIIATAPASIELSEPKQIELILDGHTTAALTLRVGQANQRVTLAPLVDANASGAESAAVIPEDLPAVDPGAKIPAAAAQPPTIRPPPPSAIQPARPTKTNPTKPGDDEPAPLKRRELPTW